MTEAEARQRLDTYYADTLGHAPQALSQPGINLAPLIEQHAFSSLFKNSILVIHAPSIAGNERSCVALAHPRLLEPLRRFLAGLSVEQLFETLTLERLTRLVCFEFPHASISPGGPLVIARFVTPAMFRPFRGPEHASIERLDEHNLFNLALLSRYSGGIYALRDEQGQILSRAGIRYESEDVWEIGVRTEVEALRGHGLAKTVVTAATEAILVAGRVPLYVHNATNVASEKVALALGYQHYADELLWFQSE
jgi:RimJ/RimL family protein N-acetyltransferase